MTTDAIVSPSAAADFIDGLRLAADFFEAHPELPPSWPTVSCHLHDVDREQALAAVASIAPCVIRAQAEAVVFSGTIGAVTVNLFVPSVLVMPTVDPQFDPAFVEAARQTELVG